ncbi:glutamine-fructose-6-phosphate transaminase [Vulcanimicrobium alpinum]|uniref:Glutamine--fructose-6-phosphate aminotransferase [isomerizing] n=1 Tax=Vulcanimicrobium alpinum TaxID=3016050 RepID=A0AAN1XZI8_UNVUL|nr:SIS domain-containing protein [Vulcanimicrobium alpinum]BDE07641.1 glutamine-fructose-6-phosphate transaminase [Vulcanimicrobium alpinum]
MLGAHFEAEIREQPDVWRRIAASDQAQRFAAAVAGRDVLFLGSGSSLFVGMLGALAFRRRGMRAYALAATEARFDRNAYQDACVVALSQSGRSADLLEAIDLLAPSRLVALTNDASSPLALRAEIVIDALAGPEIAVPASKSVTSMAAILLWAAALTGGKRNRTAETLQETAEDVRAWLDGAGVDDVVDAARRIARRRSVAVVAAGYGVPVAYELALKIKEASYVHAEGFAAGEFRHGSSAMLDASGVIIGIVDEASRDIVHRPLAEAAEAEAARYVIGARSGEIPLLGPATGEAFNSLAWLVAGQFLALSLGRANYVESDSPRGLAKWVH